MYVLYGALGCIACLALLAGGAAIGWKARTIYDRAANRHPISEAERQTQEEIRRKMKDEQHAFHTLQNYSAEQAYGLADTNAARRGGAAD